MKLIDNIYYPIPEPDEETRARTKRLFEQASKKDLNPDDEANRGLEFTALIKQGICIFAKDGNGNTPLHVAAKGGHIAQVKYLLAQGADVNARNAEGETTLHCMILKGGYPIEIIQEVLAKCDDVNARTPDGTTPLHLLIQCGTQITREMVQVFLAKGANVNVKNKLENRLLRELHSNARDILRDVIGPLEGYYDSFYEHKIPPESAKEVCQLLSGWPLADQIESINQRQQLQQMFSHAEWKDSAQMERVLADLKQNGIHPEICDIIRDNIEPYVQRYTAIGRSALEENRR